MGRAYFSAAPPPLLLHCLLNDPCAKVTYVGADCFDPLDWNKDISPLLAGAIVSNLERKL